VLLNVQVFAHGPAAEVLAEDQVRHAYASRPVRLSFGQTH
jgi:hypothetical protein